MHVNTSLKSLGLDRNDIGPEAGLKIAEALRVNTSLTDVNSQLAAHWDEPGVYECSCGGHEGRKDHTRLEFQNLT